MTPNTATDQSFQGHTSDNNPYKFIFNDHPENKKYYQRSLQEATTIILEYLEKRKTPFTGISVEEVQEKFSTISIHHDVTGVSLQEALDELKDLYLKDAILFHDPKYVAHLNCPILVPAIAAEIIVSSINTSMDTWDQSVGATFIELKLIEWTINKMGYPINADGIFTSGGTQSNFMGLFLARDYYVKNNYPIDPKMDGLPKDANKFRILCSEASHFSIEKGASLLGLGQNAVIPVPVDEQYKMDISALEKTLARLKRNGEIPIAIVGTAGTTDFGSIDPLTDIAAIAKRNNCWFHVDAAYGGGLLLSETQSQKLKGIELSDSVTIDYHKTFFQPVSSSGFFMRDKNNIDLIKYHADYLNSEEQEEAGIPNMVKKSIQTTRRFDALKLWITFRTMGTKLLGKYIDDIVYLAKAVALQLKSDPYFEVLNEPEISALVFRYVPQQADQPLTDDLYSEINLTIRKAMFQEGKALITSTKVNKVVYLKFTLLNPLTTVEDLLEVTELIKKHGALATETVLTEQFALRETY
jgi:L-2,4-diaminobutyrate decarboxylase